MKKELVMQDTNRIRKAGQVGVAAAIFWIAAITMEYRYDLKPPGSGGLYVSNQVMFLFATVGFLVIILGLAWSGAAGTGKFGRAAVGFFATGWSLLIAATFLSLFVGNNDNMLFPIGGLLASVGALLSGITVGFTGPWKGWQRWSVPFYALYYWSVLFIPLLIANREPTQITETIWGLAWMLIGIALITTPAGHSQ